VFEKLISVSARDLAAGRRPWTPDTARFCTDLFDQLAATWDTAISGQVRYEVTGPRVAGVFVIVPSFAHDMIDPETNRITMVFGDSAAAETTALYLYGSEHQRPNSPQVNGITLVGRHGLNLDEDHHGGRLGRPGCGRRSCWRGP
jgi:hypothetical protein